MNNLTDITANFGTLYFPKSALVFYQNKGTDKETYVEHFDMDKDGNPINAHPLTVREANILSKCLQTDEDKNTAFLKPKEFCLQISCISIRATTAQCYGTPKQRNSNFISWTIWAYPTERHKFLQCFG